MKTKTQKRIATTALILSFMAYSPLWAYEIQSFPNTPEEGRFVVGPAKIETSVSLGETGEVFFDIENRSGRTQEYSISFEDFTSSSVADRAVELLGEGKSQTSLKDYLFVSEENFVLNHGERARVPVVVSIPFGEKPGGKFASVVVSATSAEEVSGQSKAIVLGRIAVLLFVTVPGEINISGGMDSFKLSGSKFTFGNDLTLRIAFRNTGNVHLNPYGGVTVRNVFGDTVAQYEIDPWFVLPDSLRTRDLEISTKGLFGFYTATLELNRGYENEVETREVSFVAISPLTLVLIALVLGAITAFVRQRRKQAK